MPAAIVTKYLSLKSSMPHVHKTVVLPYSQAQMYDLVERVEDYPQFLPWCGGVVVHERTETSLEATVSVAFKGLNQYFRTSNQNTPHSKMIMQFKDGPFKSLTGQWGFEPVVLASALHDGMGVRVVFDLRYEFSNMLMAMAIGPAFNLIAQTFIDGFVKRAHVVYGQGRA